MNFSFRLTLFFAAVLKRESGQFTECFVLEKFELMLLMTHDEWLSVSATLQ